MKLIRKRVCENQTFGLSYGILYVVLCAQEFTLSDG